jgi:UDP-N-acetylmuramyl pentapeptide phosphotransferase/UDP-N-acetylglucosamine-1-phosphate transferase
MAIGWPVGVAVVFAVACLGTWLARRYALARHLLDEPGERRSHIVATPRGGGVAIVAAMLLALAISPRDVTPGLPLAPLAVGLLLVAAVGWIDDHRPLSPWLRLVVHALAAACVGASVWAAGSDGTLALASALLALVLVNVWNFMDGIDGLATSQAFLVALGCLLLAGRGGGAWLPLALAAACAGFLPFNLPRARIFLGDVGSGTLGYLLAVLVAAQATRDSGSSLLLLIPLSAFLVDATLTLARRVLRGERWWLPHTQHAYQAWTRRCGSHGRVTAAYATWTALTLLNMALAAIAHTSTVKMLALAACYLVGAMTWMALQRTPHPPGDRE